jgi:sulfite exporter TauE/SafE/copper chaperone CopZ
MTDQKPKCHTLYIDGMKCVSCEAIIFDELKEIEGMIVHEVSSKKQTAILSSDRQIDVKQIEAKLDKLGYKASFESKPEVKKERANAEQWFWSLAIVGGLYLAYKFFSLMDFGFGAVDMSNVTYGVAFLIGVVASMSTCLAVVGAVVVSFVAKFEAKGSFYEANVKPHILFHAGRMLTFFILGGLLGYIGSWFSLSGSFMGWFTVAIAIILGWLGLQILGFAPSLTSVGIHMPKGIMKHWNKMKDSDHPLAPMFLGGTTFFLPCGFTQSMQLFAIASGSVMVGGLTMLFFALGTSPILLGIGIATTRFKNMRSVIFMNAIGIVVMVFAFYTLSSGLAVAGINLDFSNKANATQAVTASDNVNVQVVNMTVDLKGYTPSVIKIKKDVPVRWVINGKQITGCTNEIIVPDLGISKKLIKGQNIVEFTPTKAGTLGFSCWMGMVRGQFIVES